jgi:serine protease Do
MISRNMSLVPTLRVGNQFYRRCASVVAPPRTMPTLAVGFGQDFCCLAATGNQRAPSGTAAQPWSAWSVGRGAVHKGRNYLCRAAATTCILYAVFISAAALAADLDALEQKAIMAAVDCAAPSVVRIETIGGLERVEGVSFGAGPTTGLIVDPAGYIVSSAFNFINKPTSILVRLPDGTRKPAKLVATDHARMIVLLKIDADKPLPVCETAPTSEMRVGQWVIALGRTFELAEPNVSVGILSAKDRVWGKALQTDASVSPANYGGPLIDIRGRVMGLIVPLSPEAADEVAGYEWYDSGIGFAIPADHIQKILPRLKKGQDLLPGFIGVSMATQNIYISEPVIGVCRFKSPAAEAGLKPGDRIVEVQGRNISRSAELREEISRRYAGDKLKLTVLRGNDRLERELTLADKIEPYQRPFLGILPMRDNGPSGVKIRYIYPNSPAAKAGLVPGDAILALDGQPMNQRRQIAQALLDFQPGQSVDLEILHDGKTQRRQLTLGVLDTSLPPAALPAAHEKTQPAKTAGLEIGTVKLKIPEFPHDAFAYVPENYDPALPYGLVVFLHGRDGFDWEKILAAWKPLCNQHDLILLAPKSSDARNWSPREADLVDRLMGKIMDQYNVDPFRIVVFGRESGGALASIIASRNREIIRALAVVNAPLAAMPQENDPQYRFAIYIAKSRKSPSGRAIEKIIPKLRESNLPLILKDLGDDPRHLNADELAELARWIDMLDSI